MFGSLLRWTMIKTMNNSIGQAIGIELSLSTIVNPNVRVTNPNRNITNSQVHGLDTFYKKTM